MTTTPKHAMVDPIPFSRPASPDVTRNQCAFIGLGEMGRRMATNMAKAGAQGGYPPLIVWNRSQDNVDEFKTWAKEHGVEDSAYKAVDSIADVVKEANIIITSLANDDAVKAVYATLFSEQEKQYGERKRPFIFVDTSTTYPSVAGDLEFQARHRPGRTFLACPVFGVPRAAEKGDLILAMAGDYFAKKIVAHTLHPAVGKKVMDLGSNVERALSFKLVGNSLELGFIELLSESFTLSEQAGVSPDKLVELISEQHKSPALLRYAKRISENRFDATGGFNLKGGMADARNIRKLADSHNVPMPTVDVAHQHMITARAVGDEKMDWTALVGGERIAAGRAPFGGKTSLEPLIPGKLEKYYG